MMRALIGGVIGLGGFALIVYSLGWLPAVGLMCAMWGNNIQTWGPR